MNDWLKTVSRAPQQLLILSLKGSDGLKWDVLDNGNRCVKTIERVELQTTWGLRDDFENF